MGTKKITLNAWWTFDIGQQDLKIIYSRWLTQQSVTIGFLGSGYGESGIGLGRVVGVPRDRGLL